MRTTSVKGVETRRTGRDVSAEEVSNDVIDSSIYSVETNGVCRYLSTIMPECEASYVLRIFNNVGTIGEERIVDSSERKKNLSLDYYGN